MRTLISLLCWTLISLTCYSQKPDIYVEDVFGYPLVKIHKNSNREAFKVMDSIYKTNPKLYKFMYLRYIVLKDKDTVYDRRILYKRVPEKLKLEKKL